MSRTDPLGVAGETVTARVLSVHTDATRLKPGASTAFTLIGNAHLGDRSAEPAAVHALGHGGNRSVWEVDLNGARFAALLAAADSVRKYDERLRNVLDRLARESVASHVLTHHASLLGSVPSSGHELDSVWLVELAITDLITWLSIPSPETTVHRAGESFVVRRPSSALQLAGGAGSRLSARADIQAAHLLTPCIEVLAAAVAGGSAAILPRDLSASNVLLTLPSSGALTKMNDLEGAKIYAAGTSLSTTSLHVQRPYAAPEECRWAREAEQWPPPGDDEVSALQGSAVTPAAEVYHFGIALHRIAFGSWMHAEVDPFRRDDLTDWQPAVRPLEADELEVLARLATDCCAYEAADRPSAADVRDRLRRLAATEDATVWVEPIDSPRGTGTRSASAASTMRRARLAPPVRHRRRRSVFIGSTVVAVCSSLAVVLALVLPGSGSRTPKANSSSSATTPIRLVDRVAYLQRDGRAEAMSPDGRHLYVATAGAHSSLLSLDTNTLTRKSVSIVGTPTAVAVSRDGRRLYVTSIRDSAGIVSTIDAAELHVMRTTPVGRSPKAIVVSRDGSRVYVSSAYPSAVHPGEVSVLDTVSGKVVGHVLTLGAPSVMALSPNGKQLYVAMAANATTQLPGIPQIAVIDLTSDRVAKRFASGGIAVALATTSSGRELLLLTATVRGGAFLAELSTTDGTTVQAATVDNGEVGDVAEPARQRLADLAVDSAGAYAYISDSGQTGAGTIAVFALAQFTVDRVIHVGGFPRSIVLSPDGHSAWVLTRDAPELTELWDALVKHPK